MERKALESLLNTVTDIKDRKYVSTKKAIHLLSRRNALYSSPIAIANEINSRIAKDFDPDDFHYPATPEVVVCSMALLGQLMLHAEGEEDKHTGLTLEEITLLRQSKLSRNSQKLGLSSINYVDGTLVHPVHTFFMDITAQENGNILRPINFLTPMYRRAQKEDMTDSIFGADSITSTFDKYPFVDPEIANQEVIDRMFSINFDKIISRQGMAFVEREYAQTLEDFALPFSERLESMKKDGFDWKSVEMKRFMADYAAQFGSYDDLVSAAARLRNESYAKKREAQFLGDEEEVVKEQQAIEFYHYVTTVLGGPFKIRRFTQSLF